jgi:histone acetyltransferase (RNA polymerase elongator complex component)
MNKIETAKYYAFLLYAAFYWFFTGIQLFWNGSTSTYEACFGFLRLRIDRKPGGDYNKEINGCGLIREVHVYGTSLTTGSGTKGSGTKGSQHRGFGQAMMKTAEAIILQHGLKKAAVIAGIGTREYYKNKCGYKKGTHYMLKNLKSSYLELLRWALSEFVWIASCILVRKLHTKNEEYK